ncbi:hypothetical protein GGR53DRAFT_140633 [Hypoxylon sp. FL1150]|nr:hypothetical protein GGR53DRAFT_140633 [Hypoxylon sp. FL1150]
MANMVEVHDSGEFVKTQDPSFTVSHVVPGYTSGRNELVHDAAMTQTQNSSNFMAMDMLGGGLPMAIHGSFAYLDDVAETHLRVALLDPATEPTDFVIASEVNYTTIFDHIEEGFHKAFAAGVFEREAEVFKITFDS